jgi:hypothetical protein
MAAGLYGRHRRRQPLDRAFTSKLMWVTVGLATALTGSVLPALWLFISFSINGGPIETNIPPGYSPQFILGVLLVGAAFTAISAIYGFLEHLRS